VSALWLATFLIGIILQVLLVARLQRGPLRRYPVLFIYCIALFLSSIIEIAAFLNLIAVSSTAAGYRRYYWTNDAVLQTLILAVMMSFLHRAMQDNPARRWISMGLGLVILVFAAWSYLSTEETKSLTKLARNLSFASAILNLALWMALIRGAMKEPQLLLLSAGIGIQTTGKAVGHAIRFMAEESRNRAMVDSSNLLIVIVHLLCLTIWWFALRSRFEPKAAKGPSTPKTPLYT